MQSKYSELFTIMNSKSFMLSAFFFLACVLCTSSCKESKNPINDKNEVEVDQVSEEKNNSMSTKKVIMFYGNSLTAGYRLEENESFPSRIEDRIDSLQMNYEVINAGLSGDTSYDGLKRLDWVLNTKVDVFVLELGANDMLRGLPVKNTKENLLNIVQKVKTKYPEAIIALCAMAGAPNMGSDYVSQFEGLYKDIAKTENITYIPFFLNGVAGNPDLLLQDGKHPNAEGQKIAANNIWNTLKTIL